MTAPSPEVVILTEAGAGIGFGHLGRCAAIYDALDDAGAAPRLVVQGLPALPDALIEGRRAMCDDWLEHPKTAVAGATIAVVDSYEAPMRVYDAVQSAVRTALWVDDEVRLDYPVGIVLNSGMTAETMPYARRPGSLYLLGPSYHPLRSAFRYLPRHDTGRLERVLVVFGGSDIRGLGPPAAASLAAAGVPQVDLVCGDRTAAEMAEAMMHADLAVGSTGQTLYELAAAGLPTVGVVVVDNKRKNAEGWARTGFLALAGDWDAPCIAERVVAEVARLSDRDARAEAAAAGRAMVDGFGASRIAARCLASAKVAAMNLASATAADSDAVLDLANDPVVRGASFSSEPISREDHERWFAARLADPNTMLLLARDDQGVVGQVRFDIAGLWATVGIALADRVRLNGLGLPLLESGLLQLYEQHPEILAVVAFVRPSNPASLTVFATA